MEATARAKNVGVSPKKLRPILNTVKGKSVKEALITLQFLSSPNAKEVAKVIKSAASNAENNLRLDPDSLRVVQIKADDGLKLRRMLPHSRGRAGVVHKRHAHITVVLGEEG